MALRKIARLGHPILRRKADPIPDPTAPDVAALARDMIETMLDAPGVGLAAPQIYESRRIVVFRVPPGRQAIDEPAGPEGIVVLIDPEIDILDPTPVEDIEGCLSIPDLRGIVARPKRILYRGFGLDGTPIVREASGFHARVVCHEVDHLDGILFLDRMDDRTRLAVTAETHHLMEALHPAPSGDGPT